MSGNTQPLVPTVQPDRAFDYWFQQTAGFSEIYRRPYAPLRPPRRR